MIEANSCRTPLIVPLAPPRRFSFSPGFNIMPLVNSLDSKIIELLTEKLLGQPHPAVRNNIKVLKWPTESDK
jgi:hypothetical protein